MHIPVLIHISVNIKYIYISATALLRAGRVEWFCCPVGCGVGFFENCHLGCPRIRAPTKRARCLPPPWRYIFVFFSIIFSMLFWHRFLVDLGSIFPPNLPPQNLQNPGKIDAKSLSILDFKFRSIFDRFWLPTWTPRTSFGASGLAPNGIFVFSGNRMSDAILVPTWLHFPPQNPPKSTKKSIPRCIKFWLDFSTDFSSMLARFWKPTWSHVGHLFLPRAVQNGPQHPPKATKTAKSLKNFENEPQKPKKKTDPT